MKIDEDLLFKFGAEKKNYKVKEHIFSEGDIAQYYFQIIKGVIKLNHYNDNGREFIHNILSDKQSFGDAFVFSEKHYPMNAITLENSEIIRLPKNRFIDLLKENPEISLELNACFSHQIYYKLKMMQNLASQNPTDRLIGLLDYYKSFQEDCNSFSFQVHLTRQQIADLTGLRVETVIRTLKKMEKEESIKIRNSKIFY